MLKKSGLFMMLILGIPLFGYLAWLSWAGSLYFRLPEGDFDKYHLRSALVASILISSVVFSAHVFCFVLYKRRFKMALQNIEALNSRAQGMSDDLVEVASYHHEQILKMISQVKTDDPCSTPATQLLQALRDAAEELSIRADKTAIDIQRLNSGLSVFYRDGARRPTSTRVRSYESAYNYR